MKNPYLHVYHLNDKTIIWNSILLKYVLISEDNNSEKLSNINLQERLPELINNFVGDEFDKINQLFSFDFCDNYREVLIKNYLKEPKIDVIYIILNRECNLRCSYCFLKNDRDKTSMSNQTIRQSIDLACNAINEQNVRPQIIFYGGEPLLNYSILKDGVRLINFYKESGKLPEDLAISLVTNGTLINREIASFLSENNINVTVSIDGPEERHDIARYGNNGKSFVNVMNGYRLLQETGMNIGISTTITKLNIQYLNDDLQDFFYPLKPFSISYNLYRPISQNIEDELEIIDGEYLGQSLFQAYNNCLAFGIREGRASRVIQSVLYRKPRINDCAGCGHQLCIYPTGDISPCQLLDNNIDEDYIGSVYQCNNYKHNAILKKWLKFSPLSNEICLRCPALACCGGGCRLMFINEDYLSFQNMYCSYIKTLLYNTLNQVISGM